MSSPSSSASSAARYAVSPADVEAAARRIVGQVHCTPVMTCATLDAMSGRKLFFKCENLQKVGAFKIRGATNAIMKLEDSVANRGVVTHSSGNHAQAVALAARTRGIDAHIVMPSNANPKKRAAVEVYGGRVYECEPNQHARESTASRIAEETGATLIPPYDHADIIAGQGTAALELLQQQPELKAIIAPIGGGGLMSGTCIAARGMSSSIRLFGAEPSAVDDAARGLESGERQPEVPNPKTIADGLLTSLGERNWPIIRDHVERIFTVSEVDIVNAMRLVWSRMKLIIEPSAAVPVAAVLSDSFREVEAERIGVIISGGNVDLDRLPW